MALQCEQTLKGIETIPGRLSPRSSRRLQREQTLKGIETSTRAPSVAQAMRLQREQTLKGIETKEVLKVATLLAAYDGAGKQIGRCDERCYDAAFPVCDCICGGKNHGQGMGRAVNQVLELGEDSFDREGCRRVTERELLGRRNMQTLFVTPAKVEAGLRLK